MDVFLSYPSGERRLAEALKRGLEAEGLAVFDVGSLAPGASWRKQLEQAAESARLFLLVIDDFEEASQWQRAEWQAALEAVWEDPSKRLVPVLPRGGEVPAFIRSTSRSAPVQAIIANKQNDGRWKQGIVQAAKRLVSYPLAPPAAGEAEVREVPYSADLEERRERSAEILRFADELRKVAG